MLPVTIIEALPFTFPSPLFASEVVRGSRFTTFSQAFFIVLPAVSHAMMFLCLCFCLGHHWAGRFRLFQIVEIDMIIE
jgi:hypothetical protein